VPAIPSAPVDVVSIDFVADAIYALCGDRGDAGQTYNLTAGAKASTIGEIAGLASRYFRRPAPTVLSPREFAALERGTSALQRSALDGSRAYFPYFAIGTVFDEARTRAQLDPAGIQVSPLADYLERLLDFATRSRWGKRPIARADALAA
jgi:nucleoside-diphosphate-sugar epimerase